MSTSPDGPLSLPLDASPAVLVGLAAERWGSRGLMDRCVHLYREMQWGQEPELMAYLAGAKGLRWVEFGFGAQDYFVRTWALRAMLYAWDRSAEPTVILALQDEHWRPREMALKVVAKRQVDCTTKAASMSRDDPVPRVRAAAERAMQRLARTNPTPDTKQVQHPV